MSTPLAVGVIIGTVVTGAAVMNASASLEARHRADLVAENAALAAADSHLGWISGDPCTLAQRVAEHGNSELVSCSVSDLNVWVEVRVNTVLGSRVSAAKAGVDETVLGV